MQSGEAQRRNNILRIVVQRLLSHRPEIWKYPLEQQHPFPLVGLRRNDSSRENLKKLLVFGLQWRGRSIGVLFAPSSPTVKPFKVRLIQNILSLLLIGFCINVIAGLIFNYNLPLLMISVVLLIVAIIPLIYILKRYPK